MKKKMRFIKFSILLILAVLTLNSKAVEAAKDQKAPTVTLQPNTTEPTSGKVKITIKATDTSGIQSVKWAVGSKSLYFVKNSGKSLTLKSGITNVSVSKNNVYTFYVRDKAGNEIIKKITVSNIDMVAPVLNCLPNTIKPTNKNVTVKITATDEGFGVKEVLYLVGTKTVEDFKDSAQSPIAIKISAEGSGSFKVQGNDSYTILARDMAGNQILQTVVITNIDKTAPLVTLNYSVLNQAATVTVNASDADSSVASVQYIKGKLTDPTSEKWSTNGKVVTAGNFIAKSTSNYSVLSTDAAGNKTIEVIHVQLEFKAVWISFLEFLNYSKNGVTESTFKSDIDKMFDNVVDMNMNAVVVQVRPFGDALYQSAYFPWSKYISGTQGVNPGFDPLAYMVEAAHKRGLEFHAWINPYRVTTASTDYTALSTNNPARIWHEAADTSKNRNVLSYGGSLYYNPSSTEVQNLVLNGIKEIVQNYDVDGIHFDDYFYPTLGTDYSKKFDNIEYNSYAAICSKAGETAMTIADWRRNNVSTLVKKAYESIKSIDSTVQFGISPGGNFDALLGNNGGYVDIKKWLSSDGYIDYVCPQIYWSFTHATVPFDKTLDKWLSNRTSSTVKMYVGIATYKAGSSAYSDWLDDDTILAEQVQYGRDTGLVDGFLFFRYNFFYDSTTKPSVENLLKIL